MNQYTQTESGYQFGAMTIPADPANRHYQQMLAEVEQGLAEIIQPPEPTTEEKNALLQQSIVDATQQRLDAFAQTKNYSGILSVCTYATSTVPKFAAEGQRAVELRDATWGALYTLLAEIESGDWPIPSGFDDIEHLLPALTWDTE